MGYRNYLFVVDRKKFAKAKKMTAEQLWGLTNEEPEDWNLDGDKIVTPPYYRNLLTSIGGEELLEVSEAIHYRNSNFNIKSYLKKAFKDKDVHRWYNEDIEFMIAKPEILNGLIEFYISKVKNYYTNLAKEDSEHPKDEFGWDLKPQLERLQKHVQSQLSWLNFVNDSKSKWCLSTAWLYEYDVFNLIHIKKMFNPKKQFLIWTGS